MNNKAIKRVFLFLSLCLFIFSVNTWAKSSNENNSSIPSNPNIIKSELNTQSEKEAELCRYCHGNIKDEKHKIYSRTDSTGSRCEHCTRTSKHITEVYTLRNVSSCSKGCTYDIIEHLPTEYKCQRLPEDLSKIIRFNIGR